MRISAKMAYCVAAGRVAVLFFAALAAVQTGYCRSFSLDLRSRRPTVLRNMTASSQPAEGGGVLRSFNLDAGVADVGDVAVGDELAFSLFDDVSLTLTLTAKMPTPLGGEAFLAEAAGYDGVKNAVVLKTANGLTVDVQDYHSGRVYKVISTKTGVSVQEIKPSENRKCGCDALKVPAMPAAPPEGEEPPSAPRKLLATSGNTQQPVTVDILVAYDTTAAEWATRNGGGIQEFAETSVQKMNTVIANSFACSQFDLYNKYFMFRLVGVYEIGGPGFVDGDNPGTACDTALDAAVYGTRLNGVSWAGVKSKREEVGADIVVTLIDIGTASGTVGIGYSYEANGASGFSSHAYNCCAIRSVAESHTMTHEVGHNMGAGHATDVNPRMIIPGPQYYSYSAGYYFNAAGIDYFTVMAYNYDGYGNSYTEVPYFSTPDIEYSGVPMGDDAHNNTLTIKKNYAAVSAFRKSKSDPEPPDPAIDAGEFRNILWKTCERFPWKIGEFPYMYSGDFRAAGGHLTGDSWVETTVSGPGNLGFRYSTYMDGGPFKAAVDGVEKFSTEKIADEWSDLEIPLGEHKVRFTFTSGGWYCSDDAYNGANIYDVRFDPEGSRARIFPASTDDEATALRFTGSLEVSISADEAGSTAYYTLDGSEPDENGYEYTGPFRITRSTVVRAVTRRRDGSYTTPVTRMFLERHAVRPGEWTADVGGALSAAAGDGTLVIVRFTESSDGAYMPFCSDYAEVTDGEDFTAWAASNRVYLVAFDIGAHYSQGFEGQMWAIDGRGRFVEHRDAMDYYDSLRGREWPAIVVVRAAETNAVIATSELKDGSDVGDGRYDGTAASIEDGLASFLRPASSIVTFDMQGAVYAVEGGTAKIRVSGGNQERSSTVKVCLAYNSAAASDLDLKGLKFPITLAWSAGEIGDKEIAIPVKADKAVEAGEMFTLQLADAVGVEIGDAAVCTVTIVDPAYTELAAKVAAGSETPQEKKTWEKLQRNGAVCVRGLAEPADGGKVTGSAFCPEGKKVTLKATAAKGFWFLGWRRAEVPDGGGVVATTPTLVIDRTAKPAANTKTSTTVTGVAEEATFYAVFAGEPRVSAILEDSRGVNMSAGKVTGTGRYAVGKKVTLKATANKGYVFRGWRVVPDSGEFVSQAASYPFVMGAEDVDFVAEFVTAEEDRAAITLDVGGVGLRRTGDGAPCRTNLTCGVAVDWPVEAGALSATTVKVSGLPPGLKLVQDKATKAYSVRGAPTAASKTQRDGGVAPYLAKFTVTTAGKSKQEFPVAMTVLPLPEWVVGTFNGVVTGGEDALKRVPPEGLVQALTVAASGKISGKIVEGGATWTLSAASFDSVDGSLESEVGSPQFRATVVGKSGKLTFTDVVTVAREEVVVPDSGDVAGEDARSPRGVVTAAEWTAWQNLWKDEPWKTAAKPFGKAPAVETSAGVSLKFAASGAVTAKYAGYSCSTTLVPVEGNEYEVFVYFPPKGAFAGYGAVVPLVWDGAAFSENR